MKTESNTFSYYKCWGFGKLLKENEWETSWVALMKNEIWLAWKAARQITDHQLYFIKRGFMGKTFEDNEIVKDVSDNEIFPFGAHKGKKFSELHDRYVLWLHEQDWLHKWPTVALYVNRRAADIKENQATPEEIKQTLQELKEELK